MPAFAHIARRFVDNRVGLCFVGQQEVFAQVPGQVVIPVEQEIFLEQGRDAHRCQPVRVGVGVAKLGFDETPVNIGSDGYDGR